MHKLNRSAPRPGRFPLWTICQILCCLLGQSAFAHTLAVKVQNPDGSPVPGMAVYLEALGRELPAASHRVAIEILQQDKGFVPYVGVVQAGSTVTFSNLDDITHHIYSVTGEARFSFNLREAEVTPEMTLAQPGQIAMGCNIHDWMSGHLLVVGTPYYGLTDAQGRVDIEVRDAGSYRIVSWHPQVANGVAQVALLPTSETITLTLPQALAHRPVQKGIDTFDFLEGY